jgi:hypothetical protein
MSLRKKFLDQPTTFKVGASPWRHSNPSVASTNCLRACAKIMQVSYESFIRSCFYWADDSFSDVNICIGIYLHGPQS